MVTRVSNSRRHADRYYKAMDKFLEVDEEAVDEIDNYVEWLKQQIGTKRKAIQALHAELDELRAARPDRGIA